VSVLQTQWARLRDETELEQQALLGALGVRR
jgi:hypothetical protein